MANDPMLARPLPKSLQERRRKPEKPQKPKGDKRSLLGVVTLSAIIGTAAAGLAMGLYYSMPEKSRSDDGIGKAEKVSELLEESTAWYSDEAYLDPDAPQNSGKSFSKRAKKLLDEAYARGARGGHFKQKTSLMTMNMRVIIDPITKEGGAEKDGDKKPVEPETSAVGQKPVRPQPAPTQKDGHLLKSPKPALEAVDEGAVE